MKTNLRFFLHFYQKQKPKTIGFKMFKKPELENRTGILGVNTAKYDNTDLMTSVK